MGRTKKPETAAYQRIYDLLENAQPVHADLVIHAVETLLDVGRDPALTILKVLEGLEPETRKHVATWMRGRFGLMAPLHHPGIPAVVALAEAGAGSTATEAHASEPLPRDIGRQPRTVAES